MQPESLEPSAALDIDQVILLMAWVEAGFVEGTGAYHVTINGWRASPRWRHGLSRLLLHESVRIVDGVYVLSKEAEQSLERSWPTKTREAVIRTLPTRADEKPSASLEQPHG